MEIDFTSAGIEAPVNEYTPQPVSKTMDKKVDILRSAFSLLKIKVRQCYNLLFYGKGFAQKYLNHLPHLCAYLYVFLKP